MFLIKWRSEDPNNYKTWHHNFFSFLLSKIEPKKCLWCWASSTSLWDKWFWCLKLFFLIHSTEFIFWIPLLTLSHGLNIKRLMIKLRGTVTKWLRVTGREFESCLFINMVVELKRPGTTPCLIYPRHFKLNQSSGLKFTNVFYVLVFLRFCPQLWFECSKKVI